MKLENGSAPALYTYLYYGRACECAMLAALLPPSPDCTVDVAGEPWLARTWSSENVGVRQRAGAIPYSVGLGNRLIYPPEAPTVTILPCIITADNLRYNNIGYNDIRHI